MNELTEELPDILADVLTANEVKTTADELSIPSSGDGVVNTDVSADDDDPPEFRLSSDLDVLVIDKTE